MNVAFKHHSVPSLFTAQFPLLSAITSVSPLTALAVLLVPQHASVRSLRNAHVGEIRVAVPTLAIVTGAVSLALRPQH
jgi:hypothetical protein